MEESGAFHPELASITRWLPRGVARWWSVPVLSRLPMPAPRLPEGFTVETHALPGTTASVRVVRGPSRPGLRPAVLWIHGGGFVIGSAKQDELHCARIAQELDAVVVSVDYRLANDHPFPAPLDDCTAAWDLVHREAASLGIDPARTVIAGQSAGGGLAAGLVLRVMDTGRPRPVLQVLIYPMIDDRTVLLDQAADHYRLWDPTANAIGWSRYVGDVGGPGVSDHAAPARRVDLSGSPPAWIGVGTLDLFHDEDRAYAERLRAAGVEVQLEVVPGAFHGFEAVLPGAPVSEAFVVSRLEAMRRALAPR